MATATTPLTYVLAGWLGPPRHVASTVMVSRDGTRIVTGSRRGNLWMWSVNRPDSVAATPPKARTSDGGQRVDARDWDGPDAN